MMKPVFKTALCSLALATTLTAPALAGPDGLKISDARLQVTIPSRPAAGYFTLTNTGSETRVLVGAASPACAKAMLHQSKMENGAMKMLPAGELEIAPGGTLSFAPGGYHVMCMKPAADIKSKETVPVTLMFKNGETMSADFTVTGVK